MWGRGSIRIGRIGGLRIDVHLTFGLVILWGGWQGWVRYGTPAGIGFGTLGIVLLFAAVLLHEIGHGLQARLLGVTVRRITLLPIGGVAEMETPSESPWQELVIALAGPLANLMAAGMLVIILILSRPLALRGWLDHLTFFTPPSPTDVLSYLLWVNLLLFFFNMLPAFPMDGGHIVRGALALWVNYENGTHIAAWMGRILAVALLVLGALGWGAPGDGVNIIFLILAPVVYLGVRQEVRMLLQRRALANLTVADVVREPSQSVGPNNALDDQLAARVLHRDEIVPVMQGERVVGLLTTAGLRRGMRRQQFRTVAHVMQTTFGTLAADDSLWRALQEMDHSALDALPVMEAERLVGMVTLDDIKQAWKHAPRRAQ